MKRAKIPSASMVWLCLLPIGWIAVSYAHALTTEQGQPLAPTWTQLSTVYGDLSLPGNSSEQTASLILDVDRDGLNDFVIASRLDTGPSVV